MVNVYARRTERGDGDNTAFGLPEQRLERKAGFVRDVAKEEDEPSEHRRRPSDAADIPQESLAARIAKRQKEG